MTNLTPDVLKSLVRLGAQARLEQLDIERHAILGAFPELRTAAVRRAPGRPRSAKPATKPASPEPAKPARKVHKMSAAERRAVSERMKKYWAKRRKAKAAKKR
jgi:hypothetical protein